MDLNQVRLFSSLVRSLLTAATFHFVQQEVVSNWIITEEVIIYLMKSIRVSPGLSVLPEADVYLVCRTKTFGVGVITFILLKQGLWRSHLFIDDSMHLSEHAICRNLQSYMASSSR